MEIKIQTMWLSAKDFETQNPITGTIKAVTQEKNKWGNDDVILLLLCGIEERKKTLYRSDLLEICRLYGNNTDKWLGKQVRFEKNTDPVTQKTKVTLRPL